MYSSLQVVYMDPGGVGYHCVYYMAHLSAKLLGAQFVTLKDGPVPVTKKLAGLLPHRKNTDFATILLCPSPYHLNAALLLPRNHRSGRLVAWVFDSFWPEKIPKWIHSSQLFDHVFITEQEDLPAWRAAVRAPVDWLPWGSDVLNLGSAKPERPCDLLRFGRQPAEWDEDALTEQRAQNLGLNFQGRPPMLEDALENQQQLMSSLAGTKFTLSFTNRVSPSIQTHPDREYITGRWTDALASGAIVAGIPPRSATVQSLLWEEALLDLRSVDPREGFEVLAASVRQWTPARAEFNYRKSLEHLDWRWRFKTLAEALDLRSTLLETELEALAGRISTGKAVMGDC